MVRPALTGRPATESRPAPPVPAGRRSRGTRLLLLLPGLVLFLAFFVAPLSVMIAISLMRGNPIAGDPIVFTLEHYRRIFGDSFYMRVLWNTIKLGLVATAASLVLGYPLAYQLARTREPGARRIMLVAVLSPMLVGIVVRIYGWMSILADTGLINATLMKLGVLSRPLPLMYNEFGIVVALVHVFIPFMILTISGVISGIDESLEEAAENLGATRWQAFREVTLPLSLPGILAGCLLVFSLTVSSYVVPILMGGFQYMTLPILVYQEIAGIFNFAFGAALAVLLLAVGLSVIVLYYRILSLVGQGVLQ